MKVEEQEEEEEMTIPHLFRCPISLELFKDPVTLCTGQTYDRSSIEQWLASGNLTCPVTMQRLQDPTFVPNHALRGVIHRWLRTGLPDRGECQSLQAVKQSLESQETPLETKLQALETVRVLSEDSSSVSCLMMIQLGFLPLLLELVFGRVVREEALTERALVCVAKLIPLSDLECLDFLKEESKIESFSCLFQQGSLAVKASLCRVIATASTSPRTRELCLIMGKTTQLLREIVFLTHDGNSEASDTAIEASWGLSCCARNHECLVGEGIVDGLISHVSRARERGSALALALALLEKLLLGLESARESLLRNPSGVRALVKRVFEVSGHEGSEGAVGSLMAVCGGSSRAREEAIEAGVLTQLLLLLQSQCSSRTKTKARMLLKLLRSN